MLQIHRLTVKKSCDTWEKMLHISFGVLLLSCLNTCDACKKNFMYFTQSTTLILSRGLFHTLHFNQVSYRSKKWGQITKKTLPKALRTQALTAFTSNFGLVGLVQYDW